MQTVAAHDMLRPADFWAGLDRQSRVLYASVAISIVLHAVLLSVHFRFPDMLRWQAAPQPLDVILVNSKTLEKPAKAEALAQANLDGGGNTDKNKRAKTPLPVTPEHDRGVDLSEAHRRVQELEEMQRKLLTQATKTPQSAPVEAPQQTPAGTPTPAVSGRELADLSLAAMRLQAQIARNVEEYQKRPRKKFIGARATEYRFAQYEEDWRMKIERVGTINYPAEARGKLYGNLRLTVTIGPEGNIAAVELDRSSGLKALDDAAFRIVHMAAPYARFPAEIRKDTDLLVITRTWFFGQGDKIWTE